MKSPKFREYVFDFSEVTIVLAFSWTLFVVVIWNMSDRCILSSDKNTWWVATDDCTVPSILGGFLFVCSYTRKIMIWVFPKMGVKPPKWMVYSGKP